MLLHLLLYQCWLRQSPLMFYKNRKIFLQVVSSLTLQHWVPHNLEIRKRGGDAELNLHRRSTSQQFTKLLYVHLHCNLSSLSSDEKPDEGGAHPVHLQYPGTARSSTQELSSVATNVSDKEREQAKHIEAESSHSKTGAGSASQEH